MALAIIHDGILRNAMVVLPQDWALFPDPLPVYICLHDEGESAVDAATYMGFHEIGTGARPSPLSGIPTNDARHKFATIYLDAVQVENLPAEASEGNLW